MKVRKSKGRKTEEESQRLNDVGKGGAGQKWRNGRWLFCLTVVNTESVKHKKGKKR